MSTDLPKTITVPEAGRMAGLSRNGAYAAVERGEIPVIRFGRLLRVPAAAWDRILSEGRPPPEPPSRDLPRR
jgi:excisionase family DNA binding protein